ncbi:glycosyltransferase family 8 protein [Neobacillus sp. CF12]|uniref:glycosyltransferase family 8 protein n=1 Tax=Neobacillus sp. CF12 TaxID=3055864 RepID=UPI00259FE90C|nr:glycosyltransferase family 8 protein [Neobacillus sp. CF12]MDM5331663.1 glycosyltransferase family 8 protein [Neobacillus sp. CF12]
METIHIVAVSNDEFAKHTAVMLNSLLVNKVSKNAIKIYIIGLLSDENQIRLNKSVEKYGIKISFFSIDQSLFKDFKIRNHLKVEVYYRLLIPELLSEEIDKAIYLDSDLIVKEDITKLWDINIENDYLAAVKVHLTSSLKKTCQSLSIPPSAGYFNNGVFVLNLKKWREDNISNLVIDYLKVNHLKLRWLEQDALNALLYNNCYKLDPKWNLTTNMSLKFRKDRRKYKRKQKQTPPAIIHFTGPRKPWNTGHHLQNEYFNYLKITLWDDNS